MKKRLTNFIGIDVSKDTLDVFDGKKSYQVKNNIKGFDRLIKNRKPETHFVMEATGAYHLKLTNHIYNKGLRVFVVNPLSVKRFSQMKLTRSKTDKADAITIRKYALVNNLKRWKAPKKYIIIVRQVQTAIDLLLKSKLAFEKQLQSFDLLPIVDEEMTDILNGEISKLDIDIKYLEDKIEQLVKKNAGAQYEVLKSIPSIGNKTAIMLIAVTNEFKNFSNSKQLCSYFGINPRTYESGTSIKKKGHISKMGMSKMRTLLFMCSLSAIRSNLPCTLLFNRLVSRGKPKKVALVAVMNKLVKQSFAIATQGVKFNLSKYTYIVHTE